MYSFLFVFWFILNQKINIETACFGIILTLLIGLFMKALFDYDLKKDIIFLKKLPLFIKYLGILIIEIVKAAFTMIGIILNKNKKVEPTLISFHSGLNKTASNFILANSITLTPGTITVKNDGDELIVHCLDKSMLDTSENNPFIKYLKKLEKDN